MFSSYVGRSLPLLMLDSRPSSELQPAATVADAVARLRAFETELRSSGAGRNAYFVSTFAYLHTVASPPPPPSRTDWTRLVPPPVLTGRVSSFSRRCERRR